jgi:hypothetical protein
MLSGLASSGRPTGPGKPRRVCNARADRLLLGPLAARLRGENARDRVAYRVAILAFPLYIFAAIWRVGVEDMLEPDTQGGQSVHRVTRLGDIHEAYAKLR